MELDEESDSPDFSGDSNDVGASEMAAMMNSAHLNATGSGSKRKHSSGNALQNKRVSGAEALAGSMDELLNSVKTRVRCLSTMSSGPDVTMGQCWAAL
ncbi:hypothetical protein LOK49_LG01G03081 [Camellia lanceoleosa]|uniref:Uncharacterized protein n=1 Tax=Camellia lanceoleosa TaxID=1840588 RepID=A0ACC0IYB5_9ERIC|nr:hypothetical protein LOK49_LG01G03081 [Camellia lanceoleosa]